MILLNKVNLAWKLLLNYTSNLTYYLGKPKTVGKPKVIFDLNDRRVEPYYFLLIYSFHKAGFNVVIRNSFMFIANIRKTGHFLFELPRLIIKLFPYKNIQPEDIIITDKIEKVNKYTAQKKIHISFDVYSSKLKHEAFITMPFFMSPNQYIYGYDKEIKDLRKSERKMKIFFSGNQNKINYTHSIFQDFFKIMNRIEILNTLKNTLTPDEILIINEKKKWTFLEDSFQNKFVLNQWTWSQGNSENLDSRVSTENWLKILSKSHFFLATPGIRMPLCFNVTEAMSVGTIPIIQYPQYYAPPLQDMKNCIVFKNSEDLTEKVRFVLSLSTKAIKELRANVIDYFDRHLQLENLPQSIKAIDDKNSTLLINATEVSYASYLKSKCSAS